MLKDLYALGMRIHEFIPKAIDGKDEFYEKIIRPVLRDLCILTQINDNKQYTDYDYTDTLKILWSIFLDKDTPGIKRNCFAAVYYYIKAMKEFKSNNTDANHYDLISKEYLTHAIEDYYLDKAEKTLKGELS